MRIFQGQPPLFFSVNIIIYAEKCRRKNPTKQSRKANVKKQKPNEKTKNLKDKQSSITAKNRFFYLYYGRPMCYKKKS